MDLSDFVPFQELNQRSKSFVLAFLRHGKAKQAYVEAGFNANSADKNAWGKLKEDAVAACIKEGNRRLAAKYSITKEVVLARAAELLHANIGDYFHLQYHPPKGGDDDNQATPGGFRLTPVDWDQLNRRQLGGLIAVKQAQNGAFEFKLGVVEALRILGPFVGVNQKLEISGPNGGPIALDPGIGNLIKDEDEEAL